MIHEIVQCVGKTHMKIHVMLLRLENNARDMYAVLTQLTLLSRAGCLRKWRPCPILNAAATLVSLSCFLSHCSQFKLFIQRKKKRCSRNLAICV